MSLLKFPIAIMSGSADKMADPQDVAWTSEQLKDNVFFNHQYEMGHMSFAIGKEMSWFTVDAMAIINKFNGRCDPSTYSSRYSEGNKICMDAEQQFLQ
jgi:hypothetical protein